jgi:hypothetical protein
MVDNFSYSHEMTFTEESYLAIWRNKLRRKWLAVISQILLGILIAALSFLSKYTISLGLAIALFFFFLGIIPFLPEPGMRKMFRSSPYLRKPLTYLVNQDGFSVNGQNFNIQAKWTFLSTWQVRGDWLILRPHTGPFAFFSVSALRKSEVLDTIMSLARKYGNEYVYIRERNRKSSSTNAS